MGPIGHIKPRGQWDIVARAPPSPGQLPTGRERGLLPRLDRRGEGLERDSTEPKGPVDGLIYTKSLLPTHRYMMRRTIDDLSSL